MLNLVNLLSVGSEEKYVGGYLSMDDNHCVKSVQIRSFFLVRIFHPSTGKYRPSKTPYLDTSRSECEVWMIMRKLMILN